MRPTSPICPTATLNPPRSDAQSTQSPQSPQSVGDLLVNELPRLKSFAARLVAGSTPPVEADDLAQEAAARALKYRDSFDAQRPIGPWLCKTVLRLYLDRRAAQLRDEERRNALGRSMQARESHPATTLEDQETIARCAAKLSARELDILLRFHQRGETLAEIAAALAIPQGTVKSHLHRARAKLVGGDE